MKIRFCYEYVFDHPNPDVGAIYEDSITILGDRSDNQKYNTYLSWGLGSLLDSTDKCEWFLERKIMVPSNDDEIIAEDVGVSVAGTKNGILISLIDAKDDDGTVPEEVFLIDEVVLFVMKLNDFLAKEKVKDSCYYVNYINYKEQTWKEQT